MQNKPFPTFEKHALATCFECSAPIGVQGKPLFYGFPNGAFALWCSACNWRTYYDTPDKSVKFDAKGDSISPTCECGCTTEKSHWGSRDGWPECPDCGMV